MAMTVFDNVLQEKPRNHFTVGINDDITLLSLPIGEGFNSIPGARRSACSGALLGRDGRLEPRRDPDHRDEHGPAVQGYFSYDAHKSRGVTVSHLRIGKQPSKAQH